MTTAASQPSRSARSWPSLQTSIGRILRNAALRALVAGQLIALAVILLRSYGGLQPLELIIYDALREHWATIMPRDRIVVVGMTESDIKRWHYPVYDEHFATLLERLASWHPRVIGVDIYRDVPEPSPTAPGGTERLNAAIKAHPEIVWGFKLGTAGDEEHAGIAPPPVLQPQLRVNGTRRIALTDMAIDTGDVMRRGLLYADDGSNNFQGLGMAVATAYLARDGIKLLPGADEDTYRLGKAVIRPLSDNRGPYIRLDEGGIQVMLEYYGGAQPFQRVSISDVMDKDLSALFAGKGVLIGDMLISVKDFFVTPFSSGFGVGEHIYGVEGHAHLADQLIEQALSGKPPLMALPRNYENAWIWGWGILGAILGLVLRSAFWAAAGSVLGVAAIEEIVFVAFGQALLLPLLPAALAWLGAAATTNQLLYAASNRARARLRKSFEHYLPAPVIEQMVKSETLPRLGGERREISVLFTDVAGFTTFSEAMDPEALAALTNEYFEGVCAQVFAEGGNVNAFIGDSVLAFFGAPVEQPDHADRAVAAGLAIARYTTAFSAEQNAKHIPFGKTRIGVHTGHAFVGNVGASQQMRYTALGDTLNTGSRLEGLNKYIGTTLCVSGAIARQAVRFQCRPVGGFVVKGRQGATEVFEPIDEERYAPDYVARYRAAFELLQAGDAAAAGAAFAALRREHPDDPCVKFHDERLRAGESGAVVHMDDK